MKFQLRLDRITVNKSLIILKVPFTFIFSLAHFLIFCYQLNNFKACCWFHFHFFLVTPGSYQNANSWIRASWACYSSSSARSCVWSSSKSGEESVAASVELGCARTRYFNFGSDNFLSFFSESADMFLLTRGSDQINAYLNQRPTMIFYDKAFQWYRLMNGYLRSYV